MNTLFSAGFWAGLREVAWLILAVSGLSLASIGVAGSIVVMLQTGQ